MFAKCVLCSTPSNFGRWRLFLPSFKRLNGMPKAVGLAAVNSEYDPYLAGA